MTTKQVRSWVPVLGILASVALFLSLPETPNVLGWCRTCSSGDPYLPLIGAGYFAALVAVSLLFPAFPGPHVARGGLTWSVLLALTLTYIKFPAWCGACLIGHLCNILIWTIWLVIPPPAEEPRSSTLGERLCLTLIAPVSVIALFSSVNLTFMAYGFRIRDIAATSLHPGDSLPAFSIQTASGRPFTNTDAAQAAGLVINFISPDCPYCSQQLPVVNALAAQLAGDSFRFINVSPALPTELVRRSPTAEWVEDKDGKLRALFHVSGYPTLFVVRSDGTIAEAIAGVPEQLEAKLRTSLVQPQGVPRPPGS